jgi:ABC-2 type transport system permease protein
MIRIAPVMAITLRSLLDQRRFWLMVLLAAVPVLLTLIGTGLGDADISDEVFDALMVQTVLPLIALIFGTGALGSELEDGTIVYLLAKPGHRARIVVGKGLVAAGVTTALVVPATVLTGIILASRQSDITETTIAYAVAVAVGGSAYALGFMALSSITSRGLAIGLGYVLIWEGILSGLLPGTQTFSVRQATLGLADMLGAKGIEDPLPATTSVVVLAAIIAGSLFLATWRMSRFQLRGGD